MQHIGSARYRIDWFTAEFGDSRTERLYRRSVLRMTTNYLTATLAVAAVILFTDGLVDLGSLGWDWSTGLLLTSRGLTAVLLLAAIYAARRWPEFVLNGVCATGCEILVMCLFMLVTVWRPLGVAGQAIRIVIFLLVVYLCFPNRFVYSLWVAASGSVAFIALMAWWHLASSSQLLVLGALVLFSNFVGAVAAHRISYSRRYHFQLLVGSRRANLKLRRVQAQLYHLATTDSLTGLSNRRHFFELAERAWSRARRYNEPLSLLFLDLDRFKGINDRFGHAVGDAVLVKVAEICRSQLRGIDIIGRLGGEEVAAVLPGATLQEAILVGQRLRAAIADQRLQEQTPLGQVTASIGVVECLHETDTIGDALRVADEALYQAKGSGGNQVIPLPMPPKRPDAAARGLGTPCSSPAAECEQRLGAGELSRR